MKQEHELREKNHPGAESMGRNKSRKLREKKQAEHLQAKGSAMKHIVAANKKKRGVLVERTKKTIFVGAFKNMTPRQVKNKKQERLKNRGK